MTLHFENKLGNIPDQRTAIFIDVAALRAQAAHSFGSNQFNIDYSYMFNEIGLSVGPISLVEMFITLSQYDKRDSADVFIKHAQRLGAHVHMCTTFRHEKILKSDPKASEKLAAFAGQQIITDINGWTIPGGARPKITTKVDMAAAITAAALSGRFDCIVFGTTDSIFSNIISRYLSPNGINSAILFIQHSDKPEFTDRTISGEFISMFNFRLRFDNDSIINHQYKQEQESTTQDE